MPKPFPFLDLWFSYSLVLGVLPVYSFLPKLARSSMMLCPMCQEPEPGIEAMEAKGFASIVTGL